MSDVVITPVEHAVTIRFDLLAWVFHGLQDPQQWKGCSFLRC